jgi:malate/lactate dehydrogenase
VPKLNEYHEFIIATTAPTPKPITNLCYDEDVVVLIFVKGPSNCGGTRMDVSITNLRIIGNLKLAIRGIEFGIHWGR